MTDPNEPVEINPDKLEQHRQQLGKVLDPIKAAADAADAPVSRDAFGAFGFFLADEVAGAAADGSEMLRAAHEAADELRQKVGMWVRDVDATEGEIMALFSTAPEMRDA
jgi:hypothetical protein